MPAREWTTPAQKAHLSALKAEFREAQRVKTLAADFWPKLEREWFIAFPEPAPAVVGTPGTEEYNIEMAAFGAQLQARKKVSYSVLSFVLIANPFYP